MRAMGEAGEGGEGGRAQTREGSPLGSAVSEFQPVEGNRAFEGIMHKSSEPGSVVRATGRSADEGAGNLRPWSPRARSDSLKGIGRVVSTPRKPSSPLRSGRGDRGRALSRSEGGDGGVRGGVEGGGGIVDVSEAEKEEGEGDDDDGMEYQKLMRGAAAYLRSRRRRSVVLAIFWVLIVLSVVQVFYLSPYSDGGGGGDLTLRREHWWQLVFTKWQEGMEVVEAAYSAYEELQDVYFHRVTWHGRGIHAAPGCRNTVQGWKWVTDDRGFLCSREEMDSSMPGCCLQEKSEQFVCRGCEGHCCETFEVCVSCCMGDEGVEGLREHYRDEEETSDEEKSKSFEICLALCRTSSVSITQQNTFLSPSRRFCHADDRAG